MGAYNTSAGGPARMPAVWVCVGHQARRISKEPACETGAKQPMLPAAHAPAVHQLKPAFGIWPAGHATQLALRPPAE